MFNINDAKNLFELYLLVSPTTGKLKDILSNFLELLSTLKGIKSGFRGMPTDINLNNISELLKYNLLYGIKNDTHFIYLPKLNIIVDENIAKNTLGNNFEENIYLSSINYQESILIGELLGYPCKGVLQRPGKVSIRYYLKTSDKFKNLFNYKEKWINITSYICEKEIFDEKINYINNYKTKLNNYFQDILDFGEIFLFIKDI